MALIVPIIAKYIIDTAGGDKPKLEALLADAQDALLQVVSPQKSPIAPPTVPARFQGKAQV
jgi:hypothetical protein